MKATLKSISDSIQASQHLFSKMSLHKRTIGLTSQVSQFKKYIGKDIKRLCELKPLSSKGKLMKRRQQEFVSIKESNKSAANLESTIQLILPSQSMPNMKKGQLERKMKTIEEEKKQTQLTTILPHTFFVTEEEKSKTLSQKQSSPFIHFINCDSNKHHSNNKNVTALRALLPSKYKHKQKAFSSSNNSFNKSAVVNSYNLLPSRNIIKENKMYSALCSGGSMKKKNAIQYMNMSKQIESSSKQMTNQYFKLSNEIYINERKLSKVTLKMISKSKEKSEAELFDKLISSDNIESKRHKRDAFWEIAQRNRLQKNLNIFRNLNESVAFQQKQYILTKLQLFHEYSQ